MKGAIVTGASQGIGAEITRRLAEEGFSLILLGRNLKKLEAVAEKLDAPTHCEELDLEKPEKISEFTQKYTIELQKDFPLNALVNNAGAIERGPFDEVDMKEWDRQYHLSVRAPIALTRALWPLLKEYKTRIVNISSTLSINSIPETNAYSSLKAAMNNWSESMAIDLAPHGVRVNCICPGIVDTPIHTDTFKNEQIKKDISNQVPLKRIGTPKDIANATYFFISDQSDWCTGSTLVLDGGLSLVR